MSLVPAEQRALDTIADALRHSDRRLARMLTRFEVPLSRGGLVIRIRRLPRTRPLRRLIVTAVAVTAAVLLVVAVIRSPATPICSAPGSLRSAAAAVQASNCSLLMHAGRVAVPAEPGTAGTPGHQHAP